MDLDELRRVSLEGKIRAQDIEARYGELKIAELEHNLRREKSGPSEDHVFTFADEILTESAQMCMTTLDVWARRDPGCDMTIILNSPGGMVMAGFALHDYLADLRSRGHKVTIKVIGSAMSMAAVVLQAADERIITPNSWLLVHEVSTAIEGNMSRIGEQSKMIQRWQDKALNILADRSGLSKRQITNRWRNKDWMLDAEEALKLGFVDRIA